MTEPTPEQTAMLNQEREEDDAIISMVAHNRNTGLMGSIALSLMRIARAQEGLLAFTETDLFDAVEAEIENRSQAKAQEIVADQTKRSFLGKKP